MSLEQIGAYVVLLCHAWLSDQPGTLPDDDALLESLSRANGRWATISPGVLAAWAREGGKIAQRYMVEERAAQKKRHQRSVQGGRQRASGPRDYRGRMVSSLASRGAPPPAVAVAIASATANPEPLAAGAAEPAVSEKNPDPKAEWIEAFENDFYPGYPRKVKPDDARRAWLAIKPWSQATLERICSGLDRWKLYWSERETAREHIPYPGPFLRSGAWKGEAG